MATGYRTRWRPGGARGLLRRVDQLLTSPWHCPGLLGRLLLGYSALDEEELLTADTLNLKQGAGRKRRSFGGINIFWKRKKYEQI